METGSSLEAEDMVGDALFESTVEGPLPTAAELRAEQSRGTEGQPEAQQAPEGQVESTAISQFSRVLQEAEQALRQQVSHNRGGRHSSNTRRMMVKLRDMRWAIQGRKVAPGESFRGRAQRIVQEVAGVLMGHEEGETW